MNKIPGYFFDKKNISADSLEQQIDPAAHHANNLQARITGIVNLPVEIHHKIADYLPAHDYARLRETCCTLRDNLISFQSLKEISQDQRSRGDLKTRSLRITLERLGLQLKNSNAIMAALITLDVKLYSQPGSQALYICFDTSEAILPEMQMYLTQPLTLLQQKIGTEFTEASCSRNFNSHINLNVLSYYFSYSLNPSQATTAPKLPALEIITACQQYLDQTDRLDKYMVAAYAEKITALSEAEPLLGVDLETLAAIKQRYAPLLATGKWLNHWVANERHNQIAYLTKQ